MSSGEVPALSSGILFLRFQSVKSAILILLQVSAFLLEYQMVVGKSSLNDLRCILDLSLDASKIERWKSQSRASDNRQGSSRLQISPVQPPGSELKSASVA